MTIQNVDVRFARIIRLGAAINIQKRKRYGFTTDISDEEYRVCAWLQDYTTDELWLIFIDTWLTQIQKDNDQKRWNTLCDCMFDDCAYTVALAGSPAGTLHFMTQLFDLGGYEYE